MGRYSGLTYTVDTDNIATICRRFYKSCALAMTGDKDEFFDTAGIWLSRFTNQNWPAPLLPASQAEQEASSEAVLNPSAGN